MQLQIQELNNLISQKYPSLKTETTFFPSGIILFDIHIKQGAIELELRSETQIGVSFIDEDTNPFAIGHDKVFTSFEEAERYVLDLVDSLI